MMIKASGCFCLLMLIIPMWTAATEQMKDEELIDRLEKSLLASFGLEERPRVDKSQIKIHPYMFHLYNQKVKQNLEEREAEDVEEGTTGASAKFPRVNSNTVRSFTHSESSNDAFHPSHKMVFHFNISSIPSREILRGAELRVMHFQHPLTSSNNSDSRGPSPKKRKWSKKEAIYLHRIHVYDVIRPARGHMDPIYRQLDTRVVDARVNETASFDISPAIKRWLKKPRTNHGIFVEVVPFKKNATIIPDPIHVRLRRYVDSGESYDAWSERQPLLVIHTDDEKLIPRREKRSVPVTAFKRINCRRYNLYVNFKSVDWDTWIVAPPGYDAFFCQGECPYPLAKHLNATNHAVIQNIIHSRYPHRVPSACCVPIKHSAISMLYLDRDKKVVLKTYQDMIVESCGCQ